MHETRNFILVLLLVGTFVWAFLAWLFMKETTPGLGVQRIAAPLIMLVVAAILVYALKFEDKLPDRLRDVVGEFYFEADGLSFMPAVRVNGDQAELCVYYQNRFEGPVEVIVHLRPPEDSFIVREGVSDIHFAFRAGGGDFGVIHQPIAVPRHLQSEVITLQLAAASYYPRSHGACWRRRPGLPCGTLPVDWSGSALKSGVHEGSKEMKLSNPCTLNLSMPIGVRESLAPQVTWRQEQLQQGAQAVAV
jgi:hypothetical protein